MVKPAVVLVGTMDTKGNEYGYVRDRLLALDVDVIVVDAGVLGKPLIQPDISRDEVARAAGTEIGALINQADRGMAIDAMAQGAGTLVVRLYEEGRLHGILGLGGSGGSTLVSAAMRRLPVGVPKLLVSTVAAGDTRPYMGSTDLTMMYSVVDIAGINRLSERILTNAAAVIAGMARAAATFTSTTGDKPLVGATMFGVTTAGVTVARERLEELGYEVLVFHATGAGGDTMESLIEAGFITAVLDVTTTELADELGGGICAAGPRRLETTGERGIPQVVSLGALDMINFGAMETVPPRYADRKLYPHNATVTLMRTSPEENAELGRRIAEKLNKAQGPLTLFVPLLGISVISTRGQISMTLRRTRRWSTPSAPTSIPMSTCVMPTRMSTIPPSRARWPMRCMSTTKPGKQTRQPRQGDRLERVYAGVRQGEYLITGGSGRLGSYAAQELLSHGHAVVNADRRPPSATAPITGGDYRYRETDLGDVGQVAGALTGCDAVIHLCAIPVAYGHADEVVFNQNTQATFAVLQAANLLGVRKAVIASSLATLGMAFGPNPKPPRYVPVDEAHPLLPADPYGLGKEVDERIGEMFHRETGMTVLAYRFHWVAMPEEAAAAAKRTAAKPEGGTRVLWGYVDIRDAATACRLGIEADGLGFEVFVIAAADTLSETPTQDLLKRYAPEVELRETIPGTASAFTTAKARRLLGYEPRCSWRDPVVKQES